MPDGASTASPPRFRNVYEEIHELTRKRMVEALEASSGARAKAAQLIGMPVRTFVTKQKQYGIEMPIVRVDRRAKPRKD